MLQFYSFSCSLLIRYHKLKVFVLVFVSRTSEVQYKPTVQNDAFLTMSAMYFRGSCLWITKGLTSITVVRKAKERKCWLRTGLHLLAISWLPLCVTLLRFSFLQEKQFLYNTEYDSTPSAILSQKC